MGGATLDIHVTGLNSSPPVNTIHFEGETKGVIGPAFQGRPLLPSDEYLSNTSTALDLTYTLEPLHELLGNSGYTSIYEPEDVTGPTFGSTLESGIRFQLGVNNGSTDIACTTDYGGGNDCDVTYHHFWTPRLYDSIPNQVYDGAVIQFIVNPRNAQHSLLLEYGVDLPIESLKLDIIALDYETTIDYREHLLLLDTTRLSQGNDYYRVPLTAKVQNLSPGAADPKILFRNGDTLFYDTARHCNWALTQCWIVQVQPVMTSQSHYHGSNLGGQAFSIYGTGFAGSATATLDDVPCVRTNLNTDDTTFTCMTGAKSGNYYYGSQPGSPGLTKTIYTPDVRNDLFYRSSGMDVYPTPLIKELATSAETHVNELVNNHGILLSGWFKAPESGRYRFYEACDDSCKIWLDPLNPFGAVDMNMETHPQELQEIATNQGHMAWRDYLQMPDPADASKKYISDWQTLTAGEYYKIESYLVEGGGNDYLSVAVEFEKSGTSTHHHTNREVQMLDISIDNIFEEFEIIIVHQANSADDGFWYPCFTTLVMGTIDTLTTCTADWVSDQATESEMYTALYPFINGRGASFVVERTILDEFDNEIFDYIHGVPQKRTLKYRVKLTKLLHENLFLTKSTSSGNSTAMFEILDTSEISPTIDPSHPLEGWFKIKCTDSVHGPYETKEWNVENAQAWDIERYLQTQIPNLSFKVQVRNARKHIHRNNGFAIMLNFFGNDGDAPSCEFVSSTGTEPGTAPLEGDNIVLSTEIVREYGENIFYEPIPMELLFTNAKKPQVRMTVDGRDAVCPDMNCQYEYLDPGSSTINSQMLENLIALTLCGLNFPETVDCSDSEISSEKTNKASDSDDTKKTNKNSASHDASMTTDNDSHSGNKHSSDDNSRSNRNHHCSASHSSSSHTSCPSHGRSTIEEHCAPGHKHHSFCDKLTEKSSKSESSGRHCHSSSGSGSSGDCGSRRRLSSMDSASLLSTFDNAVKLTRRKLKSSKSSKKKKNKKNNSSSSSSGSKYSKDSSKALSAGHCDRHPSHTHCLPTNTSTSLSTESSLKTDNDKDSKLTTASLYDSPSESSKITDNDNDPLNTTRSGSQKCSESSKKTDDDGNSKTTTNLSQDLLDGDGLPDPPTSESGPSAIEVDEGDKLTTASKYSTSAPFDCDDPPVVSDPNNAVTISFGGIPCEPITLTDQNMDGEFTKAECELVQTPGAGCYNAVMSDCFGMIVNASPDEICIPLDPVIPAELATQCINPAGGYTLFITGSGFNTHSGPDPSTQIQFSDGTDCAVVNSEPNLIECVTDPFNPLNWVFIGNTELLDIIITVNDITMEGQGQCCVDILPIYSLAPVITGVCQDDDGNLEISGVNFTTPTVTFEEVGSLLPPDTATVTSVFSSTTIYASPPDSGLGSQPLIEAPQLSNAYEITVTDNFFDATYNGAIALCSDNLCLTETPTNLITSIFPTSGSPTVQSTIGIQFDCSFTGDLCDPDFLEDLLISMTGITEGTEGYGIVQTCCIESCDEPNKIIYVNINGAWTGEHEFNVFSTDLGNLSANLFWEAVTVIDNVTPSTGSAYGGTLVTLTGYHFSNEPLEDMAYSIFIGDASCEIESRTDTEIQCRIEERDGSTLTNEPVSVYMKLSEEVDFSNLGSSMFSFVAPQFTVSALTQTFNAVTNQLEIEVEGTGLSPATELILGGVQQIVLGGGTTSSQKFQVTGQLDQSTDDILVRMPDGLPAPPLATIPLLGSIPFETRFVSISPDSGSECGTVITVKGTGFGVDSTGLNVRHMQTGDLLCEQADVVPLNYGEFTCQTKNPFPIAPGDELKLVVDANDYACSNTDPAKCLFITITNQYLWDTATDISTSSSPKVIELSSLLAYFPVSGWDAIVRYQGVETTDTLEDGLGTKITATFYGLGIANSGVGPAIPALIFVDPFDGVEHTACPIGSGPTSIPNPFVPALTTPSTPTLTCSFAGGCPYTIAAEGLAASLAADEINSITVCGTRCEFSEALSDADQATCILPSVTTSYSANNFRAEQAYMLTGTWTASDMSQVYKVHDLDTADSYIDSTASNCFIQLELMSMHHGILDEFKFFVNNRDDNIGEQKGSLMLLGSDDSTTWTQIADAVFVEVNQGWNTITFYDSEKPAYRFYKLQGTEEHSCRVTEVVLTGIEAVDDASPTYACPVEVTLNGIASLLPQPDWEVTYAAASTPTLLSVEPRYIGVEGGEVVTLLGDFIDENTSIAIYIDGIEVTVINIIDQYTIQITTPPKPQPQARRMLNSHHQSVIQAHKRRMLAACGDNDDSALEITVDGQGATATFDIRLEYASKWSDKSTWSSLCPPADGEFVYIPKGLNLLVDDATTPATGRLSGILVEGSLIAQPDTDVPIRTINTDNIIVRGGEVEFGSEEHPYDEGKLFLNFHSDTYGGKLPIFGNKVLGVTSGCLNIHGKPRVTTCTKLYQTAREGEEFIRIALPPEEYANFDWEIGEEILITTTSVEGKQSEVRTITGIAGKGATCQVFPPFVPGGNIWICFDGAPLQYEHKVREATCFDETIDQGAEVQLLTRNIVFQGMETNSPQSKDYGAYLSVQALDDLIEQTIVKISDVEFVNVGQASQIGRYAITLANINNMHDSYIRKNSIHNSFNRAIGMKMINYLKVYDNNMYHIRGHAIFFETGAETKNLIENNCITDIRMGCSILSSDHFPAGIFIQNPDNEILSNTITESDSYGIWYHLPQHPVGIADKCPDGTPMGRFEDNVVASNYRDGLLVWPKYSPRQLQCEDFTYDHDNTSEPYFGNVPISAEFKRLTAYNNKGKGATGFNLGAVKFVDFKMSDNWEANIEIEKVIDLVDGYTIIKGGLLIGKSINSTFVQPFYSETLRDEASPSGIVFPRSENLRVEDTKFCHYKWEWESAALSTCAECHTNHDMGAYTTIVKNLQFEAEDANGSQSVTQRIRYFDEPDWYRAIILDETGSLTDIGPMTWATPNLIHNRWPQCVESSILYGNGLICDETIEVRSVWFHTYAPHHFNNRYLKIARFDPVDREEMIDSESYEEFLHDSSNYSHMKQHDYKWAVPYVTGHKYHLHWGEGIDWDCMTLTNSDRWMPDDKVSYFYLNFTVQRQAINVITQPESVHFTNNTIPDSDYVPNELLDHLNLTPYQDPPENQAYNRRRELMGSQILSEVNQDDYLDQQVNCNNFVRNATDPTKYLIMQISGHFEEGSKTCKLEGHKCWPDPCPPDIPQPVYQPGSGPGTPSSCDFQLCDVNGWVERTWSDSTAWTTGSSPVQGEDVTIACCTSMTLDVQTPVLNLVTINGRLIFDNSGECAEITLRAKYVYVLGGQVIIGTQTEPFKETSVAKIELHGEQSFQHRIRGAHEFGNKVLAIAGKFSAWGWPRTRSSRLTQSIDQADQKTAHVAQGVSDWSYTRNGRSETEFSTYCEGTGTEPRNNWRDQFYFAPTAMHHTHSDYRYLQTGDPNMGELLVTEEFKYYHYGAQDGVDDKHATPIMGSSSSIELEDVTVTGEVHLLSRNIQIYGIDEDGWGCTIIVNDQVSSTGELLNGQMELDNVEVRNCSQRDTYKAAIRFESAMFANSIISNSVVHGGLGWLLYIKNSAHITIENSDFIGGRGIGVHLHNTIDVLLDGIFVADIHPRLEQMLALEPSGMHKEACVSVCSHFEGSTCTQTSVRNSVAAGCNYAGFIAPGHECGDSLTQNSFKLNTAHSIQGSGFFIYPDPLINNSKTCYEASWLTAYKCQETGLTMNYNSRKAHIYRSVFVDNVLGISIQTAKTSSGQSRKIFGYDVYIIGESFALDCPAGTGSTAVYECFCQNKFGLMLFGHNMKPRTIIHPEWDSWEIPYYEQQSDSTWPHKNSEVKLDRFKFNDWKDETTHCNMKQHIMERNPSASDRIPIHYFKNTQFNNVNQNAVAFMADPQAAWHTADECGSPQCVCTAPQNVILQFKNTQYTGMPPTLLGSTFQIVSAPQPIGDQKFGCDLKLAWTDTDMSANNGMYHCTGMADTQSKVGYLNFESLDEDTYTRNFSPVSITGGNYENIVNHFRDHQYLQNDYFTPKYLSRFVAIVKADLSEYTISTTGTTPDKMRFRLESDSLEGIKVRIPYLTAGTRGVWYNGSRVQPQPLNEITGLQAELSSQACGENRYLAGAENALEFWIKSSCLDELEVHYIDSIAILVRLDIPLTEFYSTDGPYRLIDRISSTLGIHSSLVKTVQIYEGSTIVDFIIEIIEGDYSMDEAEEMKEDLTTQIVNGILDLGAPILGMMVDNKLIVGDPIPPPEGGAAPTQGNDYSISINDGNIWDSLVTTEEEEILGPTGPITVQIEVDNSANTYIDNSSLKYSIFILILICIILLVVMIIVCWKLTCGRKKRQDVYKVPVQTEHTLQSVHGETVNDTHAQFHLDEKGVRNLVFADDEKNIEAKIRSADIVKGTPIDGLDASSFDDDNSAPALAGRPSTAALCSSSDDSPSPVKRVRNRVQTKMTKTSSGNKSSGLSIGRIEEESDESLGDDGFKNHDHMSNAAETMQENWTSLNLRGNSDSQHSSSDAVPISRSKITNPYADAIKTEIEGNVRNHSSSSHVTGSKTQETKEDKEEYEDF